MRFWSLVVGLACAVALMAGGMGAMSASAEEGGLSGAEALAVEEARGSGGSVLEAAGGSIDASSAEASSAPSATAGSLTGAPFVIEGSPTVAEQLQAEQEARLSSPEAVAEREASRLKYSSLDRAAAVALAERFFHAQESSWHSPIGQDGDHLLKYIGETSVVESTPGGRHVLVDSSVPLRSSLGSGRLEPVSLALEGRGDSFAAANPLVPLSISKSPSGGVSFPDGLSVAPVQGGSAEPPAVIGNRVFYPQTATDTDFMIDPVPLGAELSWQLRSESSPHDNALRFNLPAGATLQMSPGVPGAAEVVKEDQTLLMIPRANAVQADGQSIGVSYTVSGDTLTTHVDLSGSVAFPVMVDPLVYGYYLLTNGAYSSAGWQSASDCSCIENVGESAQLNTWQNAGSPVNDYGEWYIYAPGAGSPGGAGITRVDIADVKHEGPYESALQADIGSGNGSNPVWTFNGTDPNQTKPAPYNSDQGLQEMAMAFCAQGAGGYDGGSQPLCNEESYSGEYFQYATVAGPESVHNFNYSQVDYATVTYLDNTPPTEVLLHNLASGWTKYGVANSVWISGYDEGVGVHALRMEIPPGYKNSQGQPFFVQEFSCGSNGFTGCPHYEYSNTIDLSGLGTGAYKLGVYTIDAAQNEVQQLPDPILYIDHTPPKMNPLGGALAEAAGGVVGSGNYTLTFGAEDGACCELGTAQSGVRSLTVYVDGSKAGEVATSCPDPTGVPSSGCFALKGSWAFEGQKYGAGYHTVYVTAKDWVGNESTGETIGVTVNEAPYKQVGPGSVNLKTGDYKLAAADVSVSAAGADLTVGRSYDSRELSQGTGGPLGPQWALSLPDGMANGVWQSLSVQPNGSVVARGANGIGVTFAPSGTGFTSPAGYQTVSLTKTSASPLEYRLADAAGDATIFTRASGAGETGPMVPSGVVQATGAGGLNKVTYTFTKTVEGITEPTEVLAPIPSGVSCPIEPAKPAEVLKEGCRALTFNYAASTTATGEAPNEWGDHKGYLTRVYFTAYDPVSGAMTTVEVAHYLYDRQGRLRTEWDPRILPALKTTYGYDAEGHLTALTPPGQESWAFTYGTHAGDASTGRLLKVTRAPASAPLSNGEAAKGTEAPVLSGSPVVGVRMAVSDGAWSDGPTVYGYQWEDCNGSGGECKAILGATNPNYTPSSGDVGHTLVAQVSATNGGGSTVAVSAHSAPVVTTAPDVPSYTQWVDAGAGLNAVSCVPASSTCVVSDSKGNALYATNVSVSAAANWSAWSGPGASPSEAVDCPSSALCLMAAGSDSGYGGNMYYATSLGGTWTLAYSPSYGVDAISCPSSSFCVDGQDGYGYFRYATSPASTAWNLEEQGTATMKGASCLSSAFCVIADGQGRVHVATSTGQVESSSWTETDVDGSTALNGVACTSVNSCVIVDSAGSVLNLSVSSTGSVTVSKQDIDGTTSLTAVTCYGQRCVTVDSQGGVFVSSNSGETWIKQLTLSGKLTSVSCASSSLCVTVSDSGEVTAFDPTLSQSVDPGNSLNAVSCVPASTTCVVSDSKGDAFYATNMSTSAPASWNSWAGPGVSPSEAIACPTTTSCFMAAGSDNGYGGNMYYATARGGAWTMAYSPANGVDAISCPSSSFCLDGQDAYGYFRYSTSPASSMWELEDQGSAMMKGAFCLSSAFCALADNTGHVHIATSTSQVESSSWTETDVDGSIALNAIACTSTTSCVAVDGTGNVLDLAVASNGAALAAKDSIDAPNSLTSVACPSATTCVTVDNHGSVFVSTNSGKTWTEQSQLGTDLTAVSCASGSLCATVDTAGNVTSFNPTTGIAQEGVLRAPQPGSTIEYGVPVSGGDAPYSMSALGVAAWAQKDDPSEASAVFPADEPQGWPAGDYKRASVYYMDSANRTVNVATSSGGISTSEYDSHTNNQTRTLSADNRAAALKEGSKSAEAAEKLDTRFTYSSDGTELTKTVGPEHKIKLSSGSEVQARKQVSYKYDEKAPASGGPYRLVTKTIEAALVAGKEEDTHSTSDYYEGQNGLGWKLHAPTSSVADPAGLGLRHTTVYDPNTGNVAETRMPGAEEQPVSYRSQWGSFGTNGVPVAKPQSVAVNTEGDVWVADTENNRVQELSSLTGEPVLRFGSEGTGNGQFKKPQGVAVDPEGDVWVVDTGNSRVEVFSKTGGYITQFGSEGTATGQFKKPMGIAITSEGYVWVADTGNHRIQEFSEKWIEFTREVKFVRSVGSEGSGNGQFYEPADVAVDASGDVWAVDRFVFVPRAQEFSSAGAYVRQFGSYGTGNGQFKAPQGIATDKEGNVWVADTGNNRVQEFSPEGAYKQQFGANGSGKEQFKEPAGLAIDSQDHIYVIDTGNARVQQWFAETSAAVGAHDSQTIYYSTGGKASVTACQNHPQWANLPCQIQPAHQPETGGYPQLPVTTLTYNMWDEPEVTKSAVKTSTGEEATRTETAGYDPAGRVTAKETASSSGAALPKIAYQYSPETGLQVKQSTGTGESEQAITTTYNTLGQTTSYTDASGVTAKYEYENGADARLLHMDDGKGTQSYAYDTTTGQLATVTDSAAGTFAASYDAEGKLTTETLPNGLTEYLTYNPLGEPVSLEDRKNSYCGASCTWYTDSVTPSINGRWLAQESSIQGQGASMHGYSFDALGRLIQTQETPAGKGCTTRVYTYDQDSNRTSLTAYPPASEGKCATQGTNNAETHAYDTADRLLDPGTAYNPFGDIEVLPAADAGGTRLTSAYYADGQAQSQEQGTQVVGYQLDPGRRISQTISTGPVTETETLHYAAPGATPAWMSEPSGNWTRYIGGISGGLEAEQHNGETPVLELSNLHGDIIATATDSETATELASKIGEANEWGVPATEAPAKYSWLGSHQIPTELPSGVSMMGSRSYIPQLGRFLQPDPSPGGSANAYAYTYGNPLNETDLSGGETSGGLSAVGAGEGVDLEGGVGIGAGAIMPAPVNAQIEAEFEANPPWDQVTAGNEEYEEYEEWGEEEWEEWWEEEWGAEYAAFGPSPQSVGATEAEAAGVYVQPLAEGQEPVGPMQNKPLALCEHGHQGREGRPCGRYVCGFPMGCLKAAVHWVKKYAKKITASITAGISAAVIGGVTFVATVGCAGATAEDPLLEFDCYKIGAFGAGLTMTTAGLAVAPWIHHGRRHRR